MVIVQHQIALGEATTLTLTGMNEQLCFNTNAVCECASDPRF